jgi:hypothetical protein
MKGVVFTEFIEMVEEVWSPEVADAIITKVDPPSGGAYTSVGTYSYEEMVGLVTELSNQVNTPVPDLLRTFGRQLFKQFGLKFGDLFVDAEDAFSFLEKVDAIIHVEVRKLYSDAELPRFEMERVNDDTLVMVYESPRAMSDFGEGLMLGCFDHFGETIEIQKEDLSEGKGTKVRFELRRTSSA